MSATMSFDELREAKDLDLGHGEWPEVTQEMIDQFADATGDHQWIHIDPERAAEGPFGQTIAHGYLTVSLLPILLRGLVNVQASMGVNYGMDKLRLTSPVPSGSRVRAAAKLLDAQDKGGGLLYRLEVTVEVEGADRPAMVGTVLFLVFP